jgi:hypothetical protein
MPSDFVVPVQVGVLWLLLGSLQRGVYLDLSMQWPAHNHNINDHCDINNYTDILRYHAPGNYYYNNRRECHVVRRFGMDCALGIGLATRMS